MEAAKTIRIEEKNIRILSGDKWGRKAFLFHQEARAVLEKEKKKFLMPRAADYFMELAAGTGGMLFGAVREEKLFGMAALIVCADAQEAVASGHVTFPDALFVLACKGYTKSPIGIVQSLCRATEACCVSKALLGRMYAYAQETKIAHLFAQVAVHNTHSRACFSKAEFSVFGNWTAGHERLFLARDVMPFAEVQGLVSPPPFFREPHNETAFLGA